MGDLHILHTVHFGTDPCLNGVVNIVASSPPNACHNLAANNVGDDDPSLLGSSGAALVNGSVRRQPMH